MSASGAVDDVKKEGTAVKKLGEIEKARRSRKVRLMRLGGRRYAP